ncbi:hypothetical protein P9250_31295 [Caballeronia sp. LP006]|uniref:hypothetical protein n=1 Tax=Caballeronia sp. LP006 TaxID=3038552 RepID=UPI00286272A7|nr:hypothetical protein [Caballeronia sp. LP006]MDR5832344.1 hypothetical protein [Caballeronia sp. LP006]
MKAPLEAIDRTSFPLEEIVGESLGRREEGDPSGHSLRRTVRSFDWMDLHCLPPEIYACAVGKN